MDNFHFINLVRLNQILKDCIITRLKYVIHIESNQQKHNLFFN